MYVGAHELLHRDGLFWDVTRRRSTWIFGAGGPVDGPQNVYKRLPRFVRPALRICGSERVFENVSFSRVSYVFRFEDV